MKIKRESTVILKLAYLYIALPFLIFAAGWMKIYIAIPTIIIVGYCLWKIYQEADKMWIPEFTKDNIIKICFIVFVIAMWVYMSGIGKFVFQNSDHTVRNTIFNLLVERKWPVKNYDILPRNAGALQATGLIYYIGYWLPSAIFGKLFGLRVGYYAQAVWAVLGISLVYYFICEKAKKVIIWPLWIFIFFSGLDIIGVWITDTDVTAYVNIWHLEWWATPYQFSSMTTQLFWVFNQAIPAWICTMLAYAQKNNRNLVFIAGCSLLTSTFPFIGILLIITFVCLTRNYEETKISSKVSRVEKVKIHIGCVIKDTCTIQNILGGGTIGILSFLYLKGNLSGAVKMHEDSNNFMLQNSLPKLVLFLLLELLIFAVLLYKYNKDNKLYYFIFMMLCIIPVIKVGYGTDFCMRVSIPFLFIIMLWYMDTLSKAWRERGYVLFAGMCFVLLLGSMTPLMELKRTWTYTYQRINEGEIVYAEDYDEVEILNSSNFSGDIEHNFFFEYIAK